MSDIFYPVAHRSDEEIEALKRRYETFDERLIPEMVKAIGLTAVSWKKPDSWSTSHVIYIVTVKGRERQVVIRANIGIGEPEYYMLMEKLITDEVATVGVPVNRILHVDISRSIFPFDFQIQDCLDGVDLENNFHGTRSDYDQMSFDLGRFVAMWGDLSFEKFGRFDPTRRVPASPAGRLVGTKQSMYEYIIVRLDEDLKFLFDAGVVKNVDRIRKLFEEHKSIISVKIGTLVQYDLADHNIMFDGTNVITGIFDWEAAVIGDPILDLASAPTWKTFHPREEKMIEGYKSIRDVPNFFKEKMNIYRLRTMLWKMVYAIRTEILNEERKRKFDTALSPFFREAGKALHVRSSSKL
ncbi:MAG TPA: phosphotransferase [Patescibacteria group bacterium]|nr:phosphotransferase [Patescibacteria group bacterium]